MDTNNTLDIPGATPLVSAIITTRNRLPLLKRAIESVFAQTYANIELIVVDDASTDGTKEYCKNQNLHYISIPPHESRGGNYARNLGIKAANGEYVAFLDDDDYWLHEKTSKQLALIQEHDCEMVHGGRTLEIINPDGTVTFRDLLPNPAHWGDMSKKILLTICTTTTTTIFAKRNALIETGLFDENLKFWQEYELTIRLAQRKPFYFVNEPVAVYRIDKNDSNRLTNKYFPWHEAVKYIHRKHRGLYKKLSFYEKFKVRRLVWSDAYERTAYAGLHVRHYMYLALLSLTSPSRVVNKLIKTLRHDNK
mgnify:FL=1